MTAPLARPPFTLLLALVILLTTVTTSFAQPTEDDYYPLKKFPIPEEAYLEAGAIEFLPGGQLAYGTRRGEIWIIENPLVSNPAEAKWKRFAHGLHEILGLSERDGWLYVTHRCEVSRLKDTTGDGIADEFETVNDSWGINGDYHEYAFGSKFDRDGNIWVVLCLTGSFSSDSKYRGWCLRVSPDGTAIPTCSGIRSPGGIGANHKGDMFYTDNQGPWNGTCGLKHLKPGKFVGHPGGNKWYDLAKNEMGPRPQDPKDGSRFMIEAARIPEYEPAAILFPYSKMGKSAAGIGCDTSSGKFGPFTNQLFVGDQSDSTIMRCYLEEIDGHYQGACFPFRSGFGSGALAVEFARDGSLFVGGTNRGWGSRGPDPYSLDRVTWTGQIPFEVLKMEATPTGFRLTFTHPVDSTTASNPASYDFQAYTYIYQGSYGSPEVDTSTPKVTSAIVSKDRLSVELTLDKLIPDRVYELHTKTLRSTNNLPLLHPNAYYTLNRIPAR
jgi:glucose/arabinose dehydrogenase